jgi:hypothetical protein
MNTMQRILILLLALPCAAGSGLAQEEPDFRVWLVAMDDGVLQSPRLISAETGYNNQPLFSADSRLIYFTAEQEGGQTDVIAHDVYSGQTSLVAPTREEEYSPTPIPGSNSLSVVRVELDGRQRLWRLNPADGSFNVLLADIDPVGYHAWLSDRVVAMFVPGDSFTLHWADIGSGSSQQVFDNIGRTLRRHPWNGRVLFVDKNAEPWRIAALSTSSGTVVQVIGLFPGHEDFEVDRDGRYWMGSGSKIYRSDPANEHWLPVADFNALGIYGITRLGISPDMRMLAFVSSP